MRDMTLVIQSSLAPAVHKRSDRWKEKEKEGVWRRSG